MRKIFLILVYTIFLDHSLLAQDSTSTINLEKSKWALNFLFSRDYDYRYAHKISEPPTIVNYKTNDQISKMGWHATALVSYRCGKYLSIQTGLILDNKGYNTKTFINYIQRDKFGQIISYNYGSYKMKYYFFGIRLALNGEIALTKRCYSTFAIGINGSLEHDVIVPSGTAYSYEGGSGSVGGISINSSIGLNYYTKYNVILSLKPAFIYFLNSIQDPIAVDREYYKLHLYSFGVEFGIGFGLGKKQK